MEQTEPKRLNPLVAGVVAAVAIACIVGLGAIAERARLAGAQAPLEESGNGATPREAPRPEGQPERAGATPLCATCGTVESVRVMEVGGDAGPKRIVHRVIIRMDDGAYRAISQPVEPGYGVGEKVRIIDGSVVARE